MEYNAKPYNIEQGKPEREYKIEENGDVTITETVKSTIKFTGREFISYIRDYERSIKELDNLLSDDHRKKIESDKEYVESEFSRVSPMQKEVEAILKARYENDMQARRMDTIRETLNHKEPNKQYLDAVFNNMSEEERIKVIDALTKDEKKKLLDMKIELMRKSRGG